MCAERAPRARRGFTLVEVLVVTAVCVALAVLMTVMYKSVATSALALRSGQQEWLAQRQIREQLMHLFVLPRSALGALSGRAGELYFFTWRSRAEGLNGMPALGYFNYDTEARTLYYRELPLPAWWSDQAKAWSADRLQQAVRATRAAKVMTAVDGVSFRFLSPAPAEPGLQRWLDEWRDERPPRIVQMNFIKAGRTYSVWLETHAVEA